MKTPMNNIPTMFDPTDPEVAAMSMVTYTEQSSPTSYSKPGLPNPPAGWGRKLGMTD